MAPKDPNQHTESYEDIFRDLKTRQIYLSQMINALDAKNTAAKEWMTDSKKSIITTYKSLIEMIETGKDQDIDDILKAEQEKMKKARPAPLQNEIHIRTDRINGSEEILTVKFDGSQPEKKVFLESLAQQNAGLGKDQMDNLYDQTVLEISARRRKAHNPDDLKRPVEEQFENMDAEGLKVVIQLHDRQPLPKPTADLHSIWGVVLDIPNSTGTRAATLISEKFSQNEALTKRISEFQLGVPQSIFTEIDEETRKNIDAAQTETTSEDMKAGWWGRITGKEDRQFEEAIAETKTELLSVENNPAFAKAMNESLFDWLETMTYEREEGAEYPEPASNDHLLDQYKQADFVIRIAQNDFNETLRSFAETIVEEANEYIAFTAALSDLNKDENIEHLRTATRQDTFKNFRAWALENSKYSSLTEWAYKEIGIGYNLVKVLDIIEKNTTEKPLELLFPNDDLVSDSAKKLLAKFLPLTMDKKKYQPGGITDTLQYSQIVHKTLANVIRKSGASYENAVASSGALEKIYASEKDAQWDLWDISFILSNTIISENYPELVNIGDQKPLIDYITNAHHLIEGNCEDLDHSYIGQNELETTYAIAKMMSPETDILENYLSKPTTNGSSDIAFRLLKNGVQHNTLSPEQTIETFIENVLQDDSWTDKLPMVYQIDNIDVAQHVRSYLLSGSPETVFDRLYKTSDLNKRFAVLSFLSSPVEIANFYEDAAAKTNDADLKREYAQNVKELDKGFLEYTNGCLLNTNEITNIYFTGDDVHVNANGHEYPLPGINNLAVAGELFRSLTRTDLLKIGHEYLNPQKVDYIEAVGSNDGEYVEILNKNFTTKIYLAEDEKMSDVISRIASENPALLELNNSALINMDTLTQVFFDDENNAYFINGETCLTSLALNEKEHKALIANLGNLDHYKKVGAHFINTEAVDAISFDKDTSSLHIKCGDSFYNGTNKIRHFQDGFARFVLPSATIEKEQFETLENELKQNGFIVNEEENALINSKNICAVSVSEFMQTHQREYMVHFSNSAATLKTYSLFDGFGKALCSLPSMVKIDNTFVKADSVSNVSKSGNGTVFISMGSAATRISVTGKDKAALKTLMASKHLSDTGSELIAIDHIEFANMQDDKTMDITFAGQDNCKVQTHNSAETLDKAKPVSKKLMLNSEKRKTAELSSQSYSWSSLSRYQQSLKRNPAVILFGEKALQVSEPKKKPASSNDNTSKKTLPATEAGADGADTGSDFRVKRRGWPPQN